MAMQVLVRIFATLPELPGAWPPLELACTEDGLVVDQGKAEGPWRAEAEVRSGDVCLIQSTPAIEKHDHEANPATVSSKAASWTIEGQQWLTATHLGTAR